MSKECYSDTFVLYNVTLKFPEDLFTPRWGKYAAVAVFSKNHEQASQIQATIQQLAQKRWGGLTKDIQTPLKDGDLDEKVKQYPEYKNSFFMRIQANSEHQPKVIDEFGKPITSAGGKFVPNCKANVQLYFATYPELNGQKGMTARLQAVQYSGAPDIQPEPEVELKFAIKTQNDVIERPAKASSPRTEQQQEIDLKGW